MKMARVGLKPTTSRLILKIATTAELKPQETQAISLTPIAPPFTEYRGKATHRTR